MIPADIRLYTWLDVHDVVSKAAPQPDWLIRATAYWDGLTIEAVDGSEVSAEQWIEQVFEPRCQRVNGQLVVILESIASDPRFLPVTVQVGQIPLKAATWPLSFARPVSLERGKGRPQPLERLGEPPIVVFHSYKGGVGRTTHAMSLALAAAATQKILLVDGDFEAPGIGWLLRKRLPFPPVSFSDLLALAHGDESDEYEQTIQLVTDRLSNSLIDDCYILPAFRTTRGLPVLDIRPEHLLQSASDRYVLTHLLRSLGRKLDVGLVVVDLRAGYSELAAGLLLDSRVHRVFVTTLSGQSIDGTVELLSTVGTKAPSANTDEPYPAVIVSHIPSRLARADWRDQFERLAEARNAFQQAPDEEISDPFILESTFEPSLQLLAADWEEGCQAIGRSSAILQSTRALMEWLPQPTKVLPTASALDLVSRRWLLADFSEKRVSADNTIGDSFLNTSALRALASDHISQLPIAVVTGAKGSGKTFTFLQHVRLGTWQEYVRTSIDRKIEIVAPISPTLHSKNLGLEALAATDAAIESARVKLSLGQPALHSDLQDVILAKADQFANESDWRNLWLDCIAWRAGFEPQRSGAGKRFADYLDTTSHKLISIFDGLEDLFQNLADSSTHQTALRALIQDVPNWLAQRPTRSIGLLVFVRRDLVNLCVKQNSAQLLDRYRAYELHWDRTEALRLALWLRQQAFNLKHEDVSRLATEEQIKEQLYELWGKKLGSEESREARSSEWVLNALSDYSSQIQARDLVRFIAVAARGSIADQKWTDRDLAPSEMRLALPQCSKDKVAEIARENLALGAVFERLRRIPESDRLVPFNASSGHLEMSDLQILQDNGALYNDAGSYYLPEIYLHGLGFRYSQPGRRRVLSNRLTTK